MMIRWCIRCMTWVTTATGNCPDCGATTADEDLSLQNRVFTNCNVCGIQLRTDDEDKMGMCERCATDW